MQQRIESLGPKIEGLRPSGSVGAEENSKYGLGYDGDEFNTRTPATRTINIYTQPTGTLADSMYQQPEETEIMMDDEEQDGQSDDTETPHHVFPQTDDTTQPRSESSYHKNHTNPERDDSPGQQYLEEELYKLRQRPVGGSGQRTVWDVTRDEDLDGEQEEHGPSPSGLPTIPDSNPEGYADGQPEALQGASRDLVVTPQPPWNADYSNESQHQLAPWQRIHQRLLSWAIIWPLGEFDAALNSTTRGHQVDEVALSIWATQTYKRYVRSKMTDSPQGVVDRLFVPPNMADAINNAVFNGRHGDACGMLRDLWSPFGLEGMPRLLIVLAKHRSDPNHWVVHRYVYCLAHLLSLLYLLSLRQILIARGSFGNL